jgi:DNA topoisomerase-2
MFHHKFGYEKKAIKVSQASGYVSLLTLYEHGEDNLIDTIKKMALRFAGSNNIPLLFNQGGFGSRLELGQDGSSGRYLFTKCDMLTRDIFPVQDDVYLKNVEKEGAILEKSHYIGIIPMVLVNGVIAIGSGYSTSIPSYNPLTLIEWIRVWLKQKDEIFEDLGDGVKVCNGPDLIPYFRGFKGTVEMNGTDKVITKGILEKNGNEYTVLELPIGRKFMSITKFETKLEVMKEKKLIKKYSQKGDDEIVDFRITGDPEKELTLENLGLIDNISLTNMVLFTDEFTIKKYGCVEEIMLDFCNKRFDLYKIRREGVLKAMKSDLKYVKNKIRFLYEVNSDGEDKLILKGNEYVSVMDAKTREIFV